MAKDTIFSINKTLNLGGNLIDISTPIVMGILNTTPDSFHVESRIKSNFQLLNQAERMLNDGATILDVGGYSSRPNADDVSVEEELARVIHVIDQLVREFPEAHISIDTFRSKVAQEAVNTGATMINDISGGTLDDKMFETVAKNNACYVLMHMKGTPQSMSHMSEYDNLLVDIIDFFNEKTEQLKSLGVANVILDPGFGFAKNIDQNYEILKNLQYFQQLKLPLLAGISRKSMIYRSLDTSPDKALNGTTVLNTIALMNGAQVLRVHDVREASEAIKLYNATYS